MNHFSINEVKYFTDTASTTCEIHILPLLICKRNHGIQELAETLKHLGQSHLISIGISLRNIVRREKSGLCETYRSDSKIKHVLSIFNNLSGLGAE